MSKTQQAIQFLKEVRMETRKVTFPTKKDTIATTSAVIVVVILISFYLGIVDYVLSKIVGLAIK